MNKEHWALSKNKVFWKIGKIAYSMFSLFLTFDLLKNWNQKYSGLFIKKFLANIIRWYIDKKANIPSCYLYRLRGNWYSLWSESVKYAHVALNKAINGKGESINLYATLYFQQCN